jgi:hypothetical protein
MLDWPPLLLVAPVFALVPYTLQPLPLVDDAATGLLHVALKQAWHQPEAWEQMEQALAAGADVNAPYRLDDEAPRRAMPALMRLLSGWYTGRAQDMGYADTMALFERYWTRLIAAGANGRSAITSTTTLWHLWAATPPLMFPHGSYTSCVFDALEAMGVSVNRPNDEGETALEYALMMDNWVFAQHLVKRNGTYNALHVVRDLLGDSGYVDPLRFHYAPWGHWVEVCLSELSSEAMGTPDETGWSVLEQCLSPHLLGRATTPLYALWNAQDLPWERPSAVLGSTPVQRVRAFLRSPEDPDHMHRVYAAAWLARHEAQQMGQALPPTPTSSDERRRL